MPAQAALARPLPPWQRCCPALPPQGLQSDWGQRPFYTLLLPETARTRHTPRRCGRAQQGSTPCAAAAAAAAPSGPAPAPARAPAHTAPAELVAPGPSPSRWRTATAPQRGARSRLAPPGRPPPSAREPRAPRARPPGQPPLVAHASLRSVSDDSMRVLMPRTHCLSLGSLCLIRSTPSSVSITTGPPAECGLNTSMCARQGPAKCSSCFHTDAQTLLTDPMWGGDAPGKGGVRPGCACACAANIARAAGARPASAPAACPGRAPARRQKQH